MRHVLARVLAKLRDWHNDWREFTAGEKPRIVLQSAIAVCGYWLLLGSERAIVFIPAFMAAAYFGLRTVDDYAKAWERVQVDRARSRVISPKLWAVIANQQTQSAAPLPVDRWKVKDGVTAYRAWRLVFDGRPALQGVWVNYVWDGPVVANTIPPDDYEETVPITSNSSSFYDNSRGFYAYDTPEGAFTYYARCPSLHPQYAGLPVFGKVMLFGRVVEHDTGYRAQKAIIRELWVPQTVARLVPGWTEEVLVAQLARRYDCPVRVIPDPY